MPDYFLDTFAIIEYLKGNSNYVNAINNANHKVLTWLNRMELYFASLRELNEEIAERNFESFRIYEVSINEELVKKAMKKRLEFQKMKRKISYADAIGYQYALDNNLFFLTGDPAFAGLESVEYIRIKK